MGQNVANSTCRPHAHGTTPVTGDWEFGFHWGNESIEELTEISASEVTDLKEEATVSQAAFDTAAAGVVSWYGFTSLTVAKRAKAREACRYTFQMIAAL